MKRQRFSLIELLTVMAIAFAGATAMLTVCHDALLFVRRANQGTWANQQTVLFRDAWRQWVEESTTQDGSGLQAHSEDGLLILPGKERTRRLALPRGAELLFSREESLALAPIAVLEISWPRYGSKSGKRESIRIVAAESAP
jgi:hypothetical protein